MEAFKAKDIESNVPVNAVVAVKLKDHHLITDPENRGRTILGYWQGIKPNPKVHPAMLDELDGLHWLAEIYEISTGEVYDIHLEVIESINIGSI